MSTFIPLDSFDFSHKDTLYESLFCKRLDWYGRGVRVRTWLQQQSETSNKK